MTPIQYLLSLSISITPLLTLQRCVQYGGDHAVSIASAWWCRVCVFKCKYFFSLLKKVLHFFSLTYFCNKHNMIKHHNTKSISRRVWDFSSYSVFSVVITLVSSIANRCPLAVMCVHHHHHHRRQAGSSICVNFSWEKRKRKKNHLLGNFVVCSAVEIFISRKSHFCDLIFLFLR